MGALLTLELSFYVVNPNGPLDVASITLVDTSFGFTALINNMTLAMQIDTLNVDKVTANYCAWGKLN